MDLPSDRAADWLARLAHDLKNPLSTLRLRVELDVPEPQAAVWMADIEAASHLVDQFSAYARLQAGFEPGLPVPLADLLAVLADEPDAGVWTVDADPHELARIEGPGHALELALRNLLHNARHHGRPPVRVQLRLRAGPPREAWLLVHDAGAGIPAARLEEALQPFVRLGGVRAGHAGLGLAIVAGLARQLGGELLHQPFDGEGSALGLRWPLAAPAQR